MRSLTRVKKMAERGRSWTGAGKWALLAIWSAETIQRQLLEGTTRNTAVFRAIFERLQQRRHLRNERQCQEKIKFCILHLRKLSHLSPQSPPPRKAPSTPNRAPTSPPEQSTNKRREKRSEHHLDRSRVLNTKQLRNRR